MWCWCWCCEVRYSWGYYDLQTWQQDTDRTAFVSRGRGRVSGRGNIWMNDGRVIGTLWDLKNVRAWAKIVSLAESYEHWRRLRAFGNWGG